MNIGNKVNKILRATYLVITSPFRAAGRSVLRASRGIGEVCITGKDRIVSGVRAIGRGFRRALYGTGSAILSMFSVVAIRIKKALHAIEVGILTLGRTILGFFRKTWHMIAAGAVAAATMPVTLLFAVRRAIRRLTGPFGSFFEVKYRNFAFNLASTTMTLSIEDGHARLLVLKGDRIIAWRSGQIAQLPENQAADQNEDPKDANAPQSKVATLDKNGLEESPDVPVFNPLASLLEGLPARSNRVIADLPLYVPLLRHVPLPDVKGRYLKEIVNAEVLDSVPFAQDEVDIRWRIEQGTDIREASVVAVPKDRMDGQVGIVRDSQLAPSAIYPKDAALAAAVGRPDVFILHMAEVQTTVVLVRDGVPRIVHRIELHHETTERAEAIAMGVDQVAGYHRSQRPDDDVSSLPVVITGEVKGVPDLLGPLATTLGRPIQIFRSDLECPDGFDPAEYASNIGLFLASRSKDSAKVIAAQNVLPERHRPRPLPVVPAAVFAGLLVLGFLAFNLAGWVSGVAGELDPLNAKLDIREEQAREYRLALARFSVIDQRIADADLEALELEANLLSLEQEMDTLLSRISDIIDNAESSNVDLNRLVPTPEGFSVSGSAGSYSEVLEYAASVRSSPNFEDATVLQVADASGSRLGFTIAAIILPPELEEGEDSEAQAQSP